MAAGLQVWDPGGVLRVDLQTRVTTILGAIYVASNGSLVVPEFAKGTPFWMLNRTQTGGTEIGPLTLNVSVSGTSLIWSMKYPGSESYILTYGIY